MSPREPTRADSDLSRIGKQTQLAAKLTEVIRTCGYEYACNSITFKELVRLLKEN